MVIHHHQQVMSGGANEHIRANVEGLHACTLIYMHFYNLNRLPSLLHTMFSEKVI